MTPGRGGRRWWRARPTLAGLMVGVALLAVAFGLLAWHRRVPGYLGRAGRFRAAAEGHRWLAESYERTSAAYRGDPGGPHRDVVQSTIYARAAWRERDEAARADRLAEAYRRAARYPWASAPSAEPEPVGANHLDAPKPIPPEAEAEVEVAKILDGSPRARGR